MPELDDRRRTFFRAGHAHAGVLLVLSLVYYAYLDETDLSGGAQFAGCVLLVAGIILQSGGFFFHAFLDREDARAGIRITSIGALLLVGAIGVMVFGLF